jgi:hypothetical protein
MTAGTDSAKDSNRKPSKQPIAAFLFGAIVFSFNAAFIVAGFHAGRTDPSLRAPCSRQEFFH